MNHELDIEELWGELDAFLDTQTAEDLARWVEFDRLRLAQKDLDPTLAKLLDENFHNLLNHGNHLH